METYSRKQRRISICKERAQRGYFSLTLKLYPTERAWFKRNGFTVSELIGENLAKSILCVVSWAEAFRDELGSVTTPYSLNLENPFQSPKNLAQNFFLIAANFRKA